MSDESNKQNGASKKTIIEKSIEKDNTNKLQQIQEVIDNKGKK